MRAALILLVIFTTIFNTQAQVVTIPDTTKVVSKKTETKWHETMLIRGYMQARYNRLVETNPNLTCVQCDRSWGNNSGLFIRRARLIFTGTVGERISYYIQPDLATSISKTAQSFLQLRDFYMDINLDEKKEFRLRLGQSKVLFGWENLQSSSNRIPIDRTDGINSAAYNERDVMASFYWAPDTIRKLYTYLVKSGLKGTGDYGVIGIGAYNGQTANRSELNNNLHYGARLNYPFYFKGKIFEAGIFGYRGQFVIEKNTGTKGKTQFLDQRIGGSFVLFPQPFGFQVEYNYGEGPEFNPATDQVVSKDLNGGYIMGTYMIKLKSQQFVPYLRYQYYDGGKKFEIDARSYLVKELETGVEWSPFKGLELTGALIISDRTFEDYKTQNNKQKGSLLSLQAQVNF